MKYLNFLTILLISNCLSAQIGYRLTTGGRTAALGGCGLGLTNDGHSVFQNPAALVTIKRPIVLLATELRYGVSDLKPIGAGFALPTHSGVFGFSLQHFGFEAFRQQKIGLAFGRKLAEKLNVGIQLDYLHFNTNGYGSTHLLTFEIGCNTLIFNNLTLSAYVYNPISRRLSTQQKTPSVFRLGTAWQANEKVLILSEFEKNSHYLASFRFGIDYQIAPSLAVRCGFSTQPLTFSFGFGYRIQSNLTLDGALSQHSALGSSPSVSVSYRFGKEKSLPQ